jgi:hypothetical protein
MSKPEKPLLDDMKEEVRSLAGHVTEMAQLRWQLAQTEFRSDFAAAKRLAIWLAVAVVMTLSALPLLLASACEMLDGFLDISRAGWLLIFGLGLLSSAAMLGFMAWRHFRRRFTGMQESLEELHEDAVWLKEWTGRNEDSK